MRPVPRMFRMFFGYGEMYPPELRHLTADGKHHGQDYLCPKGTPVIAGVDGVVYDRSYHRGFGLSFWTKFWVRTGLFRWDTYRLILAHLDLITTPLKIGQKIGKFETVGRSGGSGAVYADVPGEAPREHDHLHAEVQKLMTDGTWAAVDPTFAIGNV